jgi:two-component system, LytTR family, sensor kinase
VYFFSKYFAFQIFGWGFFATTNIYIANVTHELSKGVFSINILLALFGLLFTHFYRYLIIHQKWKKSSTEKIIPYVLLATGTLTYLYIGVYYLLSKLFNFYGWMSIQFDINIGSFIAAFVLFIIWNGIYFAWHYIEYNRGLVIERLELESHMKDLEIKTIKANLQPHFIFNSLNSIRALIDENPLLAREAITKISRILRQSISQQEATDTLANELQLVEDYLDLEKIRFEERLHFSKTIEPATLQMKVPTMMLQTIVENAIKHGISKLEAGGEIIVNASVSVNTLHIQVINSGSLKSDGTEANSLGFGLSSTRQRLALLYQSNAAFNIQEVGNFVQVDIYIEK